MIIETKFDLREKVTDEFGNVGWIKAIFPDFRVGDMWVKPDEDKDDLVFQKHETQVIRCWVTLGSNVDSTSPWLEEKLTGFLPREFWNAEKGVFE